MARRDYDATVKQFKINLAADLYEALLVATSDSGRSMSAEMHWRLRQSFGESLPHSPRSEAPPLHPEIAALIDRHVQAEVKARLAKIASALGDA